MEPARSTYHHGNLRSALIDAALDLTRTAGSRGLVLRDVTRAVGVSPNAAYRHFADRESLRAAVATRIQDEMVERMLALQPPARSGMSEARARLTAVGLGYIAFALAEPGWFDVAFGGPDAFGAASAALNDATLDHPAANVAAHVVAANEAAPGGAAPNEAAPGGAGAVPAPLAFLIDALDALVGSGELAPAARAGAEWPCWSAVHGFALLALYGPLRQRSPEDIEAAAQRTVEAVITGILR